MCLSSFFMRGSSQSCFHTSNCFNTGLLVFFPSSYIFRGLACHNTYQHARWIGKIHTLIFFNQYCAHKRKWKCINRCCRQCSNIIERSWSTQGFLILFYFFFCIGLHGWSLLPQFCMYWHGLGRSRSASSGKALN